MNLFLIDTSSWVYRAFHALPPMTRPSDNLPVGAVFGFCNMAWELLHGGAFHPDDQPTHMAAVFDAKGQTTFRHALYSAYKANRSAMPDDLAAQFPYVREAVAAFGMPILELPGFEADDVIATYTKLAIAAGWNVTIVSSDKDLMQLLSSERVLMYDTMKKDGDRWGRKIGAADVEDKWGVLPDMMIDLQALMGDSTDNVPGVPGIGQKTAAELLRQYGTLENLLYHVDDVPQPKRRAMLIAHADNARLSRKLVTLDDNVPVPVPLEALTALDGDCDRLMAFLNRMEFVTLPAKVAAYMGVAFEPVPEPAPELVA